MAEPSQPPQTAAYVRLDKGALTQTFHLVALGFPARLTSTILKRVVGIYRFERGKVRNLISDPTDSKNRRMLLLSPEIQTTNLLELPKPLSDVVVEETQKWKEFLRAQQETQNGNRSSSSSRKEESGADAVVVVFTLTPHTLTLTYDHLSSDEVLRTVIPQPLPIPSSFEQVGHIAHFNLRDEYLPYKYVIGQAVLEKTPALRTVVNKSTTIHSEFRECPLELLAGVSDYDVEVHECECVYRFNYQAVYWNSRLQMEHARLVQRFTSEDYVYDAMAGVGPFALPAAKLRRVRRVKANDLNPASYQALCHNVALNKLSDKVECFNLDARDFIRQMLRQAAEVGDVSKGSHHFIMNLPASAVTFLDAFTAVGESTPPPWIHVYLFSKSTERCNADAIAQVNQALRDTGREELDVDTQLRLGNAVEVRSVAPAKVMMCVSFQYPPPKQNNPTAATKTKGEEPLPEQNKRSKITVASSSS